MTQAISWIIWRWAIWQMWIHFFSLNQKVARQITRVEEWALCKTMVGSLLPTSYSVISHRRHHIIPCRTKHQRNISSRFSIQLQGVESVLLSFFSQVKLCAIKAPKCSQTVIKTQTSNRQVYSANSTIIHLSIRSPWLSQAYPRVCSSRRLWIWISYFDRFCVSSMKASWV